MQQQWILLSLLPVLLGVWFCADHLAQIRDMLHYRVQSPLSIGSKNLTQIGDDQGCFRCANPFAVHTTGTWNDRQTKAMMSAGYSHSLVLSASGQVFSFGSNDYGQLGGGTTTSRSSPVALSTSGVLNGQKLVTIAAGDYHSLVLSATGQVFSFGWNVFGQLGDGTTTSRSSPVALSTSEALNGHTITGIAAGDSHSLVLSATGQVFSFGWNGYGQLGDGTTTFSISPAPVSTSGVLNEHTITAIAAGHHHSLVLSATGQVFSFGHNCCGQLGDDTNTDSSFPVAVSTSGALNGHRITAIAAGHRHSLVLSATGQVFSFGWNAFGQLGDDTNTDSSSPVAVSTSGVLNEHTITAIAAGHRHSLVLSASGQVFSFGSNYYGQLGDGTNTYRSSPVAVSTSGVLNEHIITSIAAGDCHSLVLSATGQVFSFGWNDYGQLGDGTNKNRTEPVAVSASGVLHLF